LARTGILPMASNAGQISPNQHPPEGRWIMGTRSDGILANVDRACGKPSSHCDAARADGHAGPRSGGREMQCVKSAWLSAQRCQKSCPVVVDKALTSRLFQTDGSEAGVVRGDSPLLVGSSMRPKWRPWRTASPA